MRNREHQPKLHAPALDLIQEEMHLSGIKIGGVPGLVGGGLFARDEIGVGDGFTAQIRALEIALYPLGCCIGAAGLNQLGADFGIPQVAECVLGEAAFFFPRLKGKPVAFARFEQWLKLLPDGSEV